MCMTMDYRIAETVESNAQARRSIGYRNPRSIKLTLEIFTCYVNVFRYDNIVCKLVVAVFRFYIFSYKIQKY